MTAYQIEHAARELFREELGDRITRPYKPEWQRYDRVLFVYGPAAELDWLEGVKTYEKKEIDFLFFGASFAIILVLICFML